MDNMDNIKEGESTLRILYEKLSKICRDNPRGEKVMVVPSLLAGNALLRSFNLAGYGFLNLQVKTLTGIALDKVMSLVNREGIQALPQVLAVRLMEEVMEELSRKGDLSYFSSLKINPASAGVMLEAVQELKEVGYSSENIPAGEFVKLEKGKDIQKILEAYQEKLIEEGYMDRVDLLEGALEGPLEGPRNEKSGGHFPGVGFLVPANLGVSPLERKYLDRLLEENEWFYLPLEEVGGLATPSSYYFNGKGGGKTSGGSSQVTSGTGYSPGTTSFLGSLYSLPSSFPEGGRVPEIDFFHSYGETAEVREVLRQIRREGLKLEDVVVYYTSREPYAQLFYEEARRCGIPVTFGEGLHLGNFLPGKLLFALLEWVKRDFDAGLLHPLVGDKAFQMDPEDEPYQKAMARELRSSGIGWGRERYERWVGLVFEGESSPEEEGNFSKRVKIKLANLIKELLNSIPLTDDRGRINPGELAGGLARVVEKRKVIQGEEERAAYNMIMDNLRLLSQSPGERVEMMEAVEWIEGIFSSRRVGSSLPAPGAIHVEGYVRGIWAPRERVFLVGLEGRKFPGKATQDPILLDVEREALSGELEQLALKAGESIYAMVQLLASRGAHCWKLTFSFPSFDTVENREESPSPLLLQVYRLVSGNRKADYSTFLKEIGPRKGFVPPSSREALSQGEWWMNRLIRRNKGKVEEVEGEDILEHFQHLKRGFYARGQRQRPVFTPYEGLISPGKSLWENGRFLSASLLEELAACPYRYFLKHILRVSPPEEVIYDPGVWLDAYTRGSLLHQIFEDFYRILIDRKEKPSCRDHLGLLESIARKRIEEQKEELPPPNQVIFEYERREILESCRLFLRSEEEHASYSTPLYLELNFGRGGEKEKGEPGRIISPVTVELPSGRYFKLRGKIDRVDKREEDGAYLVIDYKTGGTYNYRPGSRFRGGRQLQHVLYGMALEEILKEEAPGEESYIRESGYLFPTLKGEGQRVMRPYQECRGEAREILDSLCELIDRGAFVMTVEPDQDCTFCDYTAVCDMDSFKEFMEEKKDENQGEPVTSFLKVRGKK